ncbi:MAG: hypothetical protein LBT00_01160, partial [Spirochaetaceae bacterium]|nr:hypothetical protein [Spirochaetaceae bacterium]
MRRVKALFGFYCLPDSLLSAVTIMSGYYTSRGGHLLWIASPFGFAMTGGLLAMTRRGLSLRACGNIVAVGEAIQPGKAYSGTPIRLGAGPRSGLERDPAQAWSGTPIRLGAGPRSGLERDPDQAWSGTPLRLGAGPRSGLERDP